jgi:hypothetical protein
MNRQLFIGLLNKPLFQLLVGFIALLTVVLLDSATRVFSGSLASMIVISVVCTAGAGAVIWAGVAVVPGAIICKILSGLLSINTQEQPQIIDKNLDDYISEALKFGVDKAEIRNRLLTAGWQESQFDSVLNRGQTPSSS